MYEVLYLFGPDAEKLSYFLWLSLLNIPHVQNFSNVGEEILRRTSNFTLLHKWLLNHLKVWNLWNLNGFVAWSAKCCQFVCRFVNLIESMQIRRQYSSIPSNFSNVLKFKSGISSMWDESNMLLIYWHDIAKDESGVGFFLMIFFLFLHWLSNLNFGNLLLNMSWRTELVNVSAWSIESKVRSKRDLYDLFHDHCKCANSHRLVFPSWLSLHSNQVPQRDLDRRQAGKFMNLTSGGMAARLLSWFEKAPATNARPPAKAIALAISRDSTSTPPLP